jgi:chromosome segregation ATPase|tara:strand:- start:185 stop:424 length:240 start_codon:yes stop_codon:yes gene_type:complete
MSDTSKEIIVEYKDQVRLLREENADLQDACKTKDSANKRCLQKLENANEDLEQANKKIKELENKLNDIKQTNKQLLEHP